MRGKVDTRGESPPPSCRQGLVSGHQGGHRQEHGAFLQPELAPLELVVSFKDVIGNGATNQRPLRLKSGLFTRAHLSLGGAGSEFVTTEADEEGINRFHNSFGSLESLEEP